MKLWGGRFRKDPAPEAAGFLNSLSFDFRLFRQDIEGSIAHARMLGRQGIIGPEEAELLVRGLEEIREELEEGRLACDPEAEDVHSFIEARLVEKVGEVGKKLHTARSRNDQVAADLRLYLKEEIRALGGLVLDLIGALARRARETGEVIMPGYTHLQRAQPVTFAHHLLAYCEMLRRDYDRLRDCFRRVDVCPLGAGALAGTTFPVDREFVARELGFKKIAANSLDAVADRDFVAEFIFVCSLLMMHLSRFSEELVLWSSSEFGFIELDDACTTGSSIMPQKKNPDVAELVRGKTGRVYGHLVALLTVLKGLPLAYNKDLQEDKEALFDTVDTVKSCVGIFILLVETLSLNEARMLSAAGEGFTNATDLADYLVRRGVPFREAHTVVGKVVLHCLAAGKRLEDLSLEEYRAFSPAFDSDLYEFLEIRACVARRALPGGPAPAAVARALAELTQWLEEMRALPF
ncbi:MAG: argininosuccinate lyase [Firmicutes bacterium]|nr:argininosuccinate lyase [Bacillota bacterium]